MKFIQFLHMPKLSPSSKLQLSQIIYLSPGSIYILWPNWHVAKQVLSRPLLLTSNSLGTLPYPNHCHMIIFSSIFLVNLPRQISKVFVHLEALSRKYLFYISKWHEIYKVPSYAQIITLLQTAAQSNHLCEPKFNLYFMDKLARCKASVI